jgi:hypothetical protein
VDDEREGLVGERAHGLRVESGLGLMVSMTRPDLHLVPIVFQRELLLTLEQSLLLLEEAILDEEDLGHFDGSRPGHFTFHVTLTLTTHDQALGEELESRRSLREDSDLGQELGLRGMGAMRETGRDEVEKESLTCGRVEWEG